MKFAKATGGALPKDTIEAWGSVLLAVIFVLMLIGQLFSYERLSQVLQTYAQIDSAVGMVLGAIIVVLELATLPALLHMKLSKLARLVGWLAGAAVLDIWLWLTGLNIAHGSMSNGLQASIFGAKVALPTGWYTMAFLCIVALVYVVVFYRSVVIGKMFKQK